MTSLNLIGETYGWLTVLEDAGRTNDKQKKYLCKCQCGNLTTVASGNLRKGTTVSCGCYHKEASKIRGIGNSYGKTHGATQGRSRDITYVSWLSMNQRCNDKNRSYYKHYGGRGILVCDRWKSSYENFLEDMGERPTKRHTLDRIDVDGNYEKLNCRWATSKEQQNNRQNNRVVTLSMGTFTATELADYCGLAQRTILHRLDKFESGEMTEADLVSRNSLLSKQSGHILASQ